MVKIERSPTPPVSLAKQSSYKEPDVLLQLNKDFHSKCYLCEINELQSIHVEHLRPHNNHQHKSREFDWHNLFLSCPHCNLVKKAPKYTDMILDCCKSDPEAAINQTFTNGHVSVFALQATPEAQLTAELLTECFEKTNTGIRVLECQTRVNALSQTMNLLYKCLENHQKSPSDKNLRTLRGMLSRTYKFAGFTRTYVRDHLVTYPDLAEYVQI